MFESEEEGVSIGGKPTHREQRERFAWSSMPRADLLKHYADIRALLPEMSLNKLDLEEELVLQFRSLQTLQAECLADEATPLNQRVQLANAVSGLISKLAEVQESVYNQERFKAVENLLIRHAKNMPEDLAEAFLNDYQALLERQSDETEDGEGF